MQYLPILRSLVRVALADDSGPIRHQVERLIEAMREAEDKDAAVFQRMLNQSARSHEITPSRITKSSAGKSMGLERLSPSVPVPVDRETSAPLATVIFPDQIEERLPLFPTALQENIQALVHEWENTDRILAAGMRPSLTCLVYGAPGTGKTTLALWFAKRLGLPVVLARLDGLISSYLGTTARNVGALFNFANRYDCILVLDEFDAIAKVRDDPNEVGEIKRVVNALLQNIDGREHRGITVGLTNHEGLLDPAIWRRFEVQLSVPLPGYEQRVEIAKRSLGDEAQQSKPDAKLLAWLTEGLSGSELKTMAMKYRKRIILQDENEDAPIALVAQLASSTSVNIDHARVGRLFEDEAQLAHYLSTIPETKFSHTELASLFQVSSKTIGRRISDLNDEGSPA